MPDRLEKLRATLHELEAELKGIDSLDDATRKELAEAAVEITMVLTRGQRSEQTDEVAGSLRERLEEFEASHPQLALIVGRLIDGLGQLGI
jgi:chromosome segregation ATPase